MKEFDYSNMWYGGSQKEWLTGAARHHHRKRMQYCVGKLNALAVALKQVYGSAENPREGLTPPMILDAGCGDGVMTQCLTKVFGAKVFGVDYNPLRVQRAREALPDCVFVEGDLLKLPFDSGFFDIIFSHHVLEHVKEDDAALRELLRVTKKGGFVVIGIPNEGNFVCWFRNNVVQRKILKATDHVNFYSISSFKKKLDGIKDAKLVEVKGVGGVLIPHHGLHMLFIRFKLFYELFHAIAQAFPRLSDSLFFIVQKEGKECSSNGIMGVKV